MTTVVHLEPALDDARAYAAASGDLNPIHTDPQAAAAAGLPGPIMHGLWTMAKIAQALTAAGGHRPLALAELRLEFRDYVLPELKVRVEVAETDEAATWAVTAEQAGRTVVRGAGRVAE